MTKPKILVTRRWPQAVEQKLNQLYDVTFNETDIPLTDDQFRKALTYYDAILPTVTDRIDSAILNVSNLRTKILGNFGVGYTHIDIDAAKAAGIIVTNTPDVLSACTADIAMTLMLMAARRAGEGERELRARRWKGWRPTHMIGRSLTGKTLGIIGYGRIGREVAKRAYFGFGMKIIVQNPSLISKEILTQTMARQVNTVNALVEQADVISLHCPGGLANKNLIDAPQLERMKSTAIIINTARGEVINDDAVIAALKRNRIFAVGLDVFNNEPDLNPEYFSCENAVLLPHLGSATKETREAMGFKVLENLEDFFREIEPRNRVV